MGPFLAPCAARRGRMTPFVWDFTPVCQKLASEEVAAACVSALSRAATPNCRPRRPPVPASVAPAAPIGRRLTMARTCVNTAPPFAMWVKGKFPWASSALRNCPGLPTKRRRAGRAEELGRAALG